MEAICDWTNLSALDEATELLLRELKGSPTDLMKLVVRIAPRRRAVVPISAVANRLRVSELDGAGGLA